MMRLRPPGVAHLAAIAVLLMIAQTMFADYTPTPVKTAVDRVRSGGTYYSMQRPKHPPLPYNPFPELSVSWQSNNVYIVDDRSVDYEAYDAAIKASAAYQAENESFGPLGAYDYGEEVLWIEIYAMSNDIAYLTLHGTKSNLWYQLISKPNLDPGTWDLGQIIYNDTGTNQLYFDPVPTEGLPYTFYRGVEGSNAVFINANGNAMETNSAQGLSGIDGSFSVYSFQAVPADLPVAYKICGSARNGVDYTNLSGTVVIPATGGSADVTVIPYEDNQIEFEEQVILSLVLSNGYVIDPTRSRAMMTLSDNWGTNEIFSLMATGFTQVAGIDYHPPTQSLLVSHYFDSVPDWSFMRIDTNGMVTNWSTVTNLNQEKKIAVVQTTANGFNAGEMFFGTGVDGVIGKISTNGAVEELNWLTLTNSINPTLFRGSFYVDQTGIFSNNLIAVTGDSPDEGGEVWSITSSGEAALIVALTNLPRPHLEGVVTLANDVQKWGPWAGKIITGRESAFGPNNQPRPLIHAIDTNGTVASFALGIAPEDFDVIPTNQDLYITAYNEGQILKISKSLLTNFVGDLLITQEGNGLAIPPIPPKLFIVRREPTDPCSEFVMRTISVPSYVQGLEHVTFAPITLTNLPAP